MKKISFMAALTLAALTAHAATNDNFDSSRLDSARKQTIRTYLSALQSGSASTMETLFTSDGTVLSTSMGRAPAIQFFNQFLPKIKTASVSIGSIYKAVSVPDQYGASFSYHYVLKDGSNGGGSYADEFMFAKHSPKLEQVIMYENLK